RTCSARPTSCQEREKTVRRSSSIILGSTYQAAGIVDASAKGAFGLKLSMICLIESSTAHSPFRSASCPVCVALSLTHCLKLSKLDGSHVSFENLAMEAAQTGQLKFLHMFSNKVTNKPNSQIAALTAIWRFERRQNESGHPLDLRSGIAFERVK